MGGAGTPAPPHIHAFEGKARHMQSKNDRPILEMNRITKTFPGVKALDTVDFELRTGEIHALLGENGAGKSTLIKVLGGVYQPDAGDIVIQGEKVDVESPVTATKLGIAIIHQELNVIPGLTVAENVMLGQLPTSRAGFVNNKELATSTVERLSQLGLDLSPDARVGDLPVAARQLVLISQALARDPRFLVMDEPTAALGDTDIEALFDIVQKLADQGVAIIYITHKLDEIFRLAHRVTVLRDGRVTGTKKVSDTSRNELVTMMVGRQLTDMYPKQQVPIGEVLFEVRDFVAANAPGPVSFQLRRGEILGMFGLLGSGRTRLVNALFGVLPGKGRISVNGREIRVRSPRDARAAGIGLLPLERKAEGLVLPLSVSGNLILANLTEYRRLLFMDDARMRQSSQRWIEALRIVCTGQDQATRTLSGGNQQKVVLGRWLEAQSEVLILNSPTRGIDVGAKVEIYHLMGELCAQGKGVIFVSGELPELLGIADRILVMSDGRITGDFAREEATQEDLMHAAIGEAAVSDLGGID